MSLFSNWRSSLVRGLVSLARTVRGSSPLSLTNPDAWDEIFPDLKSASGEKVSRRSALMLSGIYRGVDLICSTVAKLPLYVIDAETKERDKKHPAHRCLRRRANSEISAFHLRYALTAHAILQGGGFAYIDRKPTGYELIPLNPAATYPIRRNGQLWYATTWSKGKQGGNFADAATEIRLLYPSEVLHIRGLGYDGLSGYSLIELARDDLGTARAATKWTGQFFANGASPQVVLETDKKLNDPDAVKRIRDSWDSFKVGLGKAHKTAILEEGLKAHALTINAAEAQLLESREFDLKLAANWLGLPVSKLNGDGSKAYASLEQDNEQVLNEAFDKWLCAWETECWLKLLTTEEQEAESREVEFLREALLRANAASRAAYYRTALGGRPWMTRGEVRRREGFKPLPGDDTILEPLNMGQGGANNDPKDSPTEPTTDPPAGESDSLKERYRRSVLFAFKRLIERISKSGGDYDQKHARVVAESLEPFDDASGSLAQEFRQIVMTTDPALVTAGLQQLAIDVSMEFDQ